MNAVPNEQPYIGIARWRFALVVAVLCALLGAVLVRLVMLHTVDQPFLYEQGEKRMVRSIEEPARRGVIRDRYGRPLAVSTPVVDIGLHPARIDDDSIAALAQALGESTAALAKRIRRAREQQRSFIYLDRQVEPEVAERVANLKIEGLQLEEGFRRFYPAGEVTAHLVGLVDIDNHGQEGLERAFDEYLSGSEGQRTVLKDRYGRVVKQLGVDQIASAGKDLTLTIDLRLQYLAYRELMAAVQAHGARSGSAVLLDAHSSEVLAMVNQPSYNPNNRALLKAEQMRNRAVADIIEPGSTMKPFTVAAALNTGRYRPDTAVDTSPGYLRVKQKTIRDHRNYGVLDVTGIITKSSNVGVTLLAEQIGAQNIWETFTAAGIGQATGLGLPGETVGRMPYPEQMDALRLATVSYGYGMAVSPVQLAGAYGAFSQNGCRRPVSVLRDVQQPLGCERVMSAEVAQQMLPILESVTGDKGTGRRARVEGYRVGGKTGTAHKVGSQGYEDASYTAVFAGLAPVSNPDLILVVVVDDPQGKEYYGGEVSAPVFSRIMEQALRVRQVAPDDWSQIPMQVAGGPQ